MKLFLSGLVCFIISLGCVRFARSCREHERETAAGARSIAGRFGIGWILCWILAVGWWIWA